MSHLDPQLEADLEGLVLDYMLTAGSFTSLDITNQAKEHGHRVRNREVAEWLRTNVIAIAHTNSYLYNQSLITVDSKQAGQTLAYLYHHYQLDTDEYLDRDQNPKSFSVPVVSTLHPFLTPHTPLPASTPAYTGTQYFGSREAARAFARSNSDCYKFQDQGSYNAGIGQRWSCVAR